MGDAGSAAVQMGGSAAVPVTALACRPANGPLGYLRTFAYNELLENGGEAGLIAARAYAEFARHAGDHRAERALRFVAIFSLQEMRRFEEAMEEAVSLAAACEAAGDPYDKAKALALAANLRYLAGDVERALDDLSEALFILREDADLDYWSSLALVSVAAAAIAVDLFEVAAKDLERCAAIGRQLGSDVHLSYGLYNGALNELQWGLRLEMLGQLDASREHFHRARELILRLEAETGMPEGSSWREGALVLEGFAWCALGDAELGRIKLRTVQHNGRLGGISEDHMILTLGLFRAEIEAGDPAEARKLFTQALDHARHQPWRHWETAVLAELVRLETRDHALEAATEAALRLAQHTAAALWEERERRLGTVGIRVRLHQLADEHTAVERIAHEDPLTGLANRRRLDVALGELATMPDASYSLIFVDVDEFKCVNDVFSHAVGDEVLKDVAQILRRECRSEDVVARYGGDEFVLLLLGAPDAVATRIAERVRRAVRAHYWGRLHPELTVHVSVGVATSRPGMTVTAVMNAADEAVYASKRAGRDRVTVAGELLAREMPV
jgi:diguanylate cyclase (GGDEF)-like protein